MTEITKKETRPLGVLLLGGFNFLILGLGSLFVLASLYFRSGSQSFQILLKELGKYLGAEPEATMLKKAILAQMVVAGIFTLSGLGLLLGKEIACKITVYFSFLVVFLTFGAALLNGAIIQQAFLQIIYPGILIFYFTHKNVEGYFKGLPQEPEEKT